MFLDGNFTYSVGLFTVFINNIYWRMQEASEEKVLIPQT